MSVNAASGIANATGPVGSLFPVNNALPAWDIAAGLNAVIGILAAERKRNVTGAGQLVKISLADVPTIEELQWRGVLADGQLRPRWLDLDTSRERMNAIRQGLSVLEIAEGIAA